MRITTEQYIQREQWRAWAALQGVTDEDWNQAFEFYVHLKELPPWKRDCILFSVVVSALKNRLNSWLSTLKNSN